MTWHKFPSLDDGYLNYRTRLYSQKFDTCLHNLLGQELNQNRAISTFYFSTHSLCFLFTLSIQIGSVDEESTKSDEEYDDLAMQDVQENGYKSDHEDENKIAPVTREDQSTQKQDHSLRTKSEPLSKALCSYSSLLMEKSDTKISSSVSVKARQRSLSISSMDNYGSVINDPIVSGAP